MLTATSTYPLVGGCHIQTGTYTADAPITWSAKNQGGAISTSTSYTWSGNGDLDGSTRKTVRVQYDSIGEKEGTVTIVRADESLAATCSITLSERGDAGVHSGDAGGSGCFIATAAYGSAWEPHVATLRAFRDEHMLTSAFGTMLVQLYYATSPPIADYIAERDWLRAVVRGVLTPVVKIVERID
jgi:hypothetical protein